MAFRYSIEFKYPLALIEFMATSQINYRFFLYKVPHKFYKPEIKNSENLDKNRRMSKLSF